MKKLFIPGLILSALMLCNHMVTAQTSATTTISSLIPTLTMLEVTNSSFDLDFVAPAEAGGGLAAVTNSSSYLHYTSILSGSTTNTIAVSIASELPDGVTLTVMPSEIQGEDSDGAMGTFPTSAVSLSTTSTDLITSIGSAFTGLLDADGYYLEYTLSVNDGEFEQLVGQDFTINITYTIGESQ